MTRRWQLWGRLVGAGLLAATGGIHLDLYLTGYRTIPTIGWLFLLQVIAAFALALLVAATRSRLVWAAGAGFAASTLGGYLLSIWVGLFGFKEVRTTSGIVAGALEVASVAVLGLLAIIPPDGAVPRPALLDRLYTNAPRLQGAVVAASLLATALLVVALATSAGPVTVAKGARPELKARHVGKATVLTNAHGFTLYRFAPDTPTRSRCNGTCVVYWPPVIGTPRAGPGVTGTLGTIRRSGGAVQATYDGRPLYSYIGDSGPGQASGNRVDLNGGYWYEVTVAPKP